MGFLKITGMTAVLAAVAAAAPAYFPVEDRGEGPTEIRTRGPAAKQVLPPVTPPPLREPDETWVETTLAGMTLQEKIGQMIMPHWTNSGSAASLENTYHVGGFIFLAENSSTILTATNSLQQQAEVPLLFSIDCEAGSGARISDGTHFPMNMGLAASQREDLAFQQGVATARECRSVGVHIGLGPVLDTNTEPVNPIIGIRSFGDRPSVIEQMAEQYVLGAKSAGLLTTFKHYPGHGPTVGDTHQSLQVVNIDCDELQSRHVRPYETLIQKGVGDVVMTAHVWYPCLDPGLEATPGTLSHPALTTILRDRIGFDGVAMSDAFNMNGLTVVSGNYEGARVAVQAGLDVVLFPASVSDSFNGILDAVNGGQITQDRIDQSARRILRLKSKAGLPEAAIVPTSHRTQTMGHPDHTAVAEAIGAEAVSIAAQAEGVLPLQSADNILCLALFSSSSIFYLDSYTNFTGALQGLLPNVDIQTVDSSVSAGTISSIVASASSYDKVVVASRMWRLAQPAGQVNLVNQLLQQSTPVVYISFGSPWHIDTLTGIETYVLGYSSHYATQQAAARVLVGDEEGDAMIPVTIKQLGEPEGLAVY